MPSIAKKKHLPKWYRKFSNIIKHPPKDHIGALRKLGHILKHHAPLLSHSQRKRILRIIKKGEAHGAVRHMIYRKIRHNAPGFGKKKQRRSHLTIKVKAGKCGGKFFKRLGHMLRKYHKNKTHSAMRKIRRFMRRNFKMHKNTWKNIKHSIQNGSVATKKSVRKLVTKIKNHIPRKHIKKHHWTKYHHQQERKRNKLKSGHRNVQHVVHHHHHHHHSNKNGHKQAHRGHKKKPWWHFW